MIHATFTKTQLETLLQRGMQRTIDKQVNQIELQTLEIIFINFDEDGNLISMDVRIRTSEDAVLNLD